MQRKHDLHTSKYVKEFFQIVQFQNIKILALTYLIRLSLKRGTMIKSRITSISIRPAPQATYTNIRVTKM